MRARFLASLLTSLLVLLLIWYESPPVQAQANNGIAATIFGQTFVRGTGKPVTQEVTFSVPPLLEPPFMMIVRNGDSFGGKRVSSAVVSVNGEEVLDPSDFNQNVETIEREVFLSPENTLEVELRSPPGASLDITITGIADPTDFDPPLPPDPGEAGKATPAGIDSDGDGVRDDVQRYILANYFFASPTTVMALRQLASHFQSVLLEADDAQTSIDDINTYFDSKDCLRHVRPSDWYTVAADFRQEFLNTELRSQAWNAAGTHYDGQSRRVTPLSETPSQCNFELVPGGAP